MTFKMSDTHPILGDFDAEIILLRTFSSKQ